MSEVDPVLLARATEELTAQSGSLNADEIAAAARGVRDGIDRLGVADREERLRASRCLRKGRVVDGLRRVSLVLDTESDAILMGAIDHAMSPSNEQLALDTLVQLVRIGVEKDDGKILGARKPHVRVTVNLEDLRSEAPGAAWLEGSDTAVSAATARRFLCDGAAIPLVLGGNGDPLEMGRGRRLFSQAQRVALAVRDGGCMIPGCDRPPSWVSVDPAQVPRPLRSKQPPWFDPRRR